MVDIQYLVKIVSGREYLLSDYFALKRQGAKEYFGCHCNMQSCKDPFFKIEAKDGDEAYAIAMKLGWKELPSGDLCPVCAAAWDGVSEPDWYGAE
jgi:rubredoxin